MKDSREEKRRTVVREKRKKRRKMMDRNKIKNGMQSVPKFGEIRI